MAGVEGQRGQNRENFALEMAAQQLPLRRSEVLGGEHPDIARIEFGFELIEPATSRAFQHRCQTILDGLDLFERRHAIGRRQHRRGGAELTPKPGDPDHKKLIQVAEKDGEEFDPFEQRIAQIEGFGQNPAVEFEPGKFPVGELLLAAEISGLSFRRAAGAGIRTGRGAFAAVDHGRIVLEMGALERNRGAGR